MGIKDDLLKLREKIMSNTKKEVIDNSNKENLVVTKNINNDTKQKI